MCLMHWTPHGKAAIYKDPTLPTSGADEVSAAAPAVLPPTRRRRGASALGRAASNAIAALARALRRSDKRDR